MPTPPSPAPWFQIGDRVQLTAPLASIATGAIGIVVNRLAGGLLYEVQFEGHPGTHLVDGKRLALQAP
jgi:hypothetical protein